MLTYQDVSRLFLKVSGLKEAEIRFHTVSSQADAKQPKGLFVPINDESGTLQEAISNGAIAALWPEEVPIPSYTPNHFPIFFAQDHLKGLVEIMKSYYNYLVEHEDIKERTEFIFPEIDLLNEGNKTYHIAVMAEKINGFDGNRCKAGEE